MLPKPPDWHRPADKHRVFNWYFRNPFHNFDHYVIGVEDKKFYRSGRYPERNSDPNGGWVFAIGRHLLAHLPFVSFERSWCTFYFDWREHEAFGVSLRFHGKNKSNPPPSENDNQNAPKEKAQMHHETSEPGKR